MQWLIRGSIGLLVWSCLSIFPDAAHPKPQSLPTSQLRLLTVPVTIAQQPETKETSTITLKGKPLRNVRLGEAIQFKLDRLPNPNEGTLAVFLDQTDITSQVQQTGVEFVYQPTLIPLAPGDHAVTVYLIKPGNVWTEFAIFAIKVESAQPAQPTPSPIPTQPPSTTPQPQTPAPQPTETPASQPSTQARDLTITPKLSVNFKSQMLDARTGSAGQSERPTFADIAFTGGIAAQYQRGNLNLQTNINLAGSTFQQEALRFGTLGEAAPRIDLSDYLIRHPA